MLPILNKGDHMITIKYIYKQRAKNGNREIESIQKVNSNQYEHYIAKAQDYNKDTSNELYISEVTDCNATPRHTTCLGFTRIETPLNDFNIRARDLKYSQLGNDPFNCVYNIPTLEFWYVACNTFKWIITLLS